MNASENFSGIFHQLVYTSYVGLLPIPTDTKFYNYRLILTYVRVTGNLWWGCPFGDCDTRLTYVQCAVCKCYVLNILVRCSRSDYWFNIQPVYLRVGTVPVAYATGVYGTRYTTCGMDAHGRGPIRFHDFDVIIRSHILILGVDPTVKQYTSTTVT